MSIIYLFKKAKIKIDLTTPRTVDCYRFHDTA
jgi:hypothetical protein